MKTPKRTKVCPECGEAATLQWELFRDYCDEFDVYAAWACPKCGWKSNGVFSNTAIDFARIHRKNRVRQFKRTISRLKALANMEKPFDETWWEILGREDEIRAKHQARAARWKAAAKRWWKAEHTCWQMVENMADEITALKGGREELLDELEATRKELEIALKWREKYKAELERVKGGQA